MVSFFSFPLVGPDVLDGFIGTQDGDDFLSYLSTVVDVWAHFRHVLSTLPGKV
jgi:hypothetical protein